MGSSTYFFYNDDDESEFIDEKEFTTLPSGYGSLEIRDNFSSPDLTGLSILNHEKVVGLAPVIGFLMVCLVCGFLGNVLVCYVYRCRFRRTTSNFFIVFMAVQDLVACIVGIPFQLAVVVLPYTFNVPEICKVVRFVETVTLSAGGLTLSWIAFDRYYKICKPHEEFTLYKAKMFSVLTVVTSLIVAVPALILFGKHTVSTKVPGLNGTECSIDDSHESNTALIVYYVCLMSTFVFSFVCINVIYLIIGCHMCCCRNTGLGDEMPSRKREYPKKHRFMNSDSSSASSLSRYGSSSDDCRRSAAFSAGGSLRKSGSVEDANKVTTIIYKPQPQPRRTESQRLQMQQATPARKLSVKSTRITLIFCIISGVFIVCFLPFAIVHILKVMYVAFNPVTSYALELVYNFSVRIYFISNVIKPILYITLYPNFRRECRNVFKKLRVSCTKH